MTTPSSWTFHSSLQTDFQRCFERGEGMGSKICRGSSLAFLNSAAELVNKVAGSQSLFLFPCQLFFFFSSLPQYKYPGAVSFLFGMNVMIFRGCDWLRGLSSGTHLLAWGHGLPLLWKLPLVTSERNYISYSLEHRPALNFGLLETARSWRTRKCSFKGL